MEVFHGIEKLNRALKHPVLTIGNFDGVHQGHRHIFEIVREKARARGGESVAYTFRPHPQVALRPGIDLQLLSTYDEKLELMSASGLDIVIEEPFSREFSTISPEYFFTGILLHQIGVEAIVVGYDFAFGKERQGELEALEMMCSRASIELTIVPPQRIDGEIASSSRIRQCLLRGELRKASSLLGRDFSYRGIVIRGEGRGTLIGFPTANLKLENKLVLPYGVYATTAVVDAGHFSRTPQIFPSVTNIGVRPTFHTGELPALIETYLLDQTIDLYGRTLEVRFVEKLRDEMKFSGVESLKEQIVKDVAKSREIIAKLKSE